MADRGKAEIVISAVDQTKAAFDSIAGSFRSLQGLAVGVTAAGFGKMVVDAANFADEMGKAAQKVGVTTESLSALKYAADLSDVSFEGLQTGLKKLSVAMNQAATGQKAASDAFKQVGISVRDANGNMKGADVVLAELAGVFSKMPDGAQKTALAVQLLGRAGADLIPMLNGGAEALRAMTDEARAFGLVVNSDTAKAAEQFNDNMTRLAGMANGFKIAVGNSVIPALVQISEKMVQAAKDGGVLYGILKGIGEAEGIILFGTDEQQRQKRKQDLQREIADLNKELQSGMARTDKGVIPMPEQYRAQLVMQIRKNALELNSLANQEAARAAKDAAGNQPKTDLPIIPTGGTTKAAGTNPWAAEAKDIADLIGDINKLNTAELSSVEALQQRLNAYVSLDPALRAYMQAQLEIARIQEQAVRSEEAMAAFYEAQDIGAQSAAELADAEAEQLRQRDANFATYYENIIRETEDLNLALITSDTKRVEAQIALDKQREISAIQSAGYTAEQVEIAMEAVNEKYQAKLEGAQNGLAKTNDLAKELGLTFTSAFEDAVIGGKKFSDVLQGLADDIQRVILRKTVTEPLGNFISGALDNFDLGSFFNFGGGRATGGPVSAGTTYLVGERGPELFTPGSGGNIIPNLGGAGVNINIINNTSAQVTTRAETTNGQMSIDVVIEQVSNGLARDMRRGVGALTGAMEGTYGLNRAVGAVR